MLCTSQTYLDSPTNVGLFGLKRRQAATICVTYPPNPLSVKGAYLLLYVSKSFGSFEEAATYPPAKSPSQEGDLLLQVLWVEWVDWV